MRDADIIRVLTTAFPEFQVDSYSQGLPTIVYGDFAIYIRSKALHDGPHDPQVRRAFDFINTVFASVPADNDLINTIEVSVLELFVDDPRMITLAKTLLEGDASESFRRILGWAGPGDGEPGRSA